MTQDFSVNEFVTFQGIVEGRNDPAMIGRVRVRIFGLHNEDKTETLPWAQVLMPVTGSRSISVPKEGEWVFGYFQDGKNRQHPVILGVYPGILPKPTTITETLQAGNNFKVSPLINTAPPSGAPQPPAGIKTDRAGEPTVPPTGRGVVIDTIISSTNKKTAVACDPAIAIRAKFAGAKFWTTQIGKAIREAIKALLKALGSAMPSTGGLANMIKSLSQWIKKINKFLKDMNDSIGDFIKYIQQIRAVIEYILSLPQALLQMFMKCLGESFTALVECTKQLFGDFGTVGGELGDFSEVSKNLKELQSEMSNLIGQTTQLISTPALIVGAIVNPSGYTFEQKEKLTMELFGSKNSSNTEFSSGM